MTAMAESPAENPAERPMPSLPPMNSPAATPISTSTPAPTATRTPPPVAKKIETPKATVAVAEFETYSPDVRKIVDLGLELAARNLGYKYASADPARGGMDCSGFIYYVLAQSGVKDAPRDAREQYTWIRKAGNFQAVLAQRDDTFELDALKPGDLLFWATNFGLSREPEITQTMIYLGREQGTNQRIMIGASEGSTYKGQKRAGVNVFDFKVGRAAPKSNKEETGPVFVGYGRIPGVGGK